VEWRFSVEKVKVQKPQEIGAHLAYCLQASDKVLKTADGSGGNWKLV